MVVHQVQNHSDPDRMREQGLTGPLKKLVPCDWVSCSLWPQKILLTPLYQIQLMDDLRTYSPHVSAPLFLPGQNPTTSTVVGCPALSSVLSWFHFLSCSHALFLKKGQIQVVMFERGERHVILFLWPLMTGTRAVSSSKK